MEEIKRKFALPFAELALLVSQTVAKMTRDATEFAARGVDAAAITAFETLGNTFEVFPPDEVYVGEIKDLTTEKNTLRDTVTDEIQLISGFFEQKWGAGSGKYTSLRIKGLHRMTDANFLLTSRNVVEMATAYLADLTPIGLTQTIIDSLEDNAQLLEDKLVEINSKKELRDDKARERVELANELYDYLTLYCKIGKLIWENVNEAKYNDYVIYHAAAEVPGKVTGLAYDTPTTTLSWNMAPRAEDYQAEFRNPAPGFDWSVCYEGAATSTVHNPGPGGWLYRCRAQNEEGYGEWSDELTVIIPT